MNADGQQGQAVTTAVVYTQPHCAACKQVMKYLGGLGVPVVSRDVLTDASALAELEAQGYLTTPVTRIGDRWIAGFKRAALDEALQASSGSK